MNIKHIIAAALIRAQIRGATRFHKMICKGARIEVKTKHGLILSLSPYEYVDSNIIKNGYYEEEVLDAISTRIQPGDVFWDVGANLGLHALTLMKSRQDVSAFAFEPNPAMATLIRQAAVRNGITVGVSELALDSESGVAEFYIHEGNAGRSGLHNWDNDPALSRIQVRKRTGDDLAKAKEVPTPNIIKIDVEGNEFRALSGMSDLLRAGAIHTVVFEDSPLDTSDVKLLLRRLGFSVNTLSRREMTGHNLENFIAKKAS